ncbi:hypothetical protein [Natronobacterium gregoryi]|uniref:Uncharacterized protein n=2 Tax=Natronobacterium gregoryi TaxID=44930 RepID=L0AK06_NATGS|nr:hypothetical protein [Natronobacterium gregoryi]AFZ73517.1 hypothetical protein Natgr_2345 [Natronobacterium gregoryi SP2]ELY68373.1 hypothetical protein C490_09873 [Natronobacterium gregoryi SP2]PLK20579.1 hypothetical protein CYV19_09055 [Natronobacterium gregoryi SP2]SFJ16467.1 hypothetical protein SAMN05443661_11620 [Natronobacterium gregoryi]
MYAILTDDPGLARAGSGDRTYYFVESVDGTTNEPLEGAVASVACWGDTATVEADPERAAVSADGTRATPDSEGHQWGTVCPTDPDYRTDLLERLEELEGDVRLTTLGFPGESFCYCDRCDRQFEDSGYDDRTAWRSAVITEFVADTATRVDGELTATLYPDPYPGHLQERAGIDVRALAAHVDGFLVPLCSPGYETTYWVESLARGFVAELEGLGVDLSIQLSAAEIEPERLAEITRKLEEHADEIVYGTSPDDADTARETIDRLREKSEVPA